VDARGEVRPNERRLRNRLVICAMVLGAFAVAVLAADTSGKILGTVKDPSDNLAPQLRGMFVVRKEVALAKWPCGVPAMVSSVSDKEPVALREMKRLPSIAAVASTLF
jgi:hypothetical protein